MISKTYEKLRDPEYRSAYVASQINIGIPFQLRALLKSRRKTQEWLAEKAGMLQPRISSLLNPGKTRPNIETLRRLAEAFDCGLAVRFVPFSELVQWSEGFDPEEFSVPDFDNDTGFKTKNELQRRETPSVVTGQDFPASLKHLQQGILPLNAKVRSIDRIAVEAMGHASGRSTPSGVGVALQGMAAGHEAHNTLRRPPGVEATTLTRTEYQVNNPTAAGDIPKSLMRSNVISIRESSGEAKHWRGLYIQGQQHAG